MFHECCCNSDQVTQIVDAEQIRRMHEYILRQFFLSRWNIYDRKLPFYFVGISKFSTTSTPYTPAKTFRGIPKTETSSQVS